MARADPHSFADSSQPFHTHISLCMYLDFPSSTLHCSALYTLPRAHTGPLTLDTRSLSVHSALNPSTLEPIPFSLLPASPVLGRPLTLQLSSHSAFLLTFSSPPSASSALHWLRPPQTASQPFVYTQCQPIHARSVLPCQDTPAARFRYSALVNLPAPLSAVMSASRSAPRRAPARAESRGACPDHVWCADGRVVEEFHMDQPIPPYLFALAAGELASREVGLRTRVYVEGGGGEALERAAREFEGTEELIGVGEGLFGPYEWERFDLLVLPMSFPYGGMENPRMVFLTPTVIRGDGTGKQVVAHELAHSWTGNLITNKSNEDFWLNEGFTTYAERRIVEAVQGEDAAALNIGIGWRGLNEEMERFKDNTEFTKLKQKQEGIDPDSVYSQVPYEKGFQFLWRIERQIGRPAFDQFLKKYIATFKFQSIDTETFLEFLKMNIPGIEKQIDLDLWVYGTGIPADAVEPVSTLYTQIMSLAKEFELGRMPREDEVAEWHGQEWELYLENLPNSVEASQVAALNARYQLAESQDWEVKVAFLQLAISTGCKEFLGQVECALRGVGRMKYLRPIYRALVHGNGKEEEKIFAKRVYLEARDSYHPIAQSVVEDIFSKHL